MGYPAVRFGRSEWLAAYRSWGMNCGPGALAGVLGLLPDQAHALLPHFARKGFTTEWMMEEALRTARIPWRPDPGIWPAYGLARVLWRGPWWDDPKPFAREYHSHWVGVRGRNGSPDEIFDINAIEQGGWIPFAEWRDNLVPWLLGWAEPEATGGFEVSDAYALDRPPSRPPLKRAAPDAISQVRFSAEIHGGNRPAPGPASRRIAQRAGAALDPETLRDQGAGVSSGSRSCALRWISPNEGPSSSPLR